MGDFLGAHDAFTTSKFANAAQFDDVAEQLTKQHIRALHFTSSADCLIDTEACVCDTILGCQQGNILITPGLARVANWLRSHPMDIIVILVDVEGDITALDMSLQASGISNLTFPLQNHSLNS